LVRIHSLIAPPPGGRGFAHDCSAHAAPVRLVTAFLRDCPHPVPNVCTWRTMEDLSVTDQSIEFIRIDGYPVRVTSLRRDGEPGTVQVVSITRGTRDPELLRDILAKPVVEIAIPDETPFPATVASTEIRSSGEAATMVTRFAIEFRHTDGASPPPPTVEDRIATLERDVADLRAIVDRLVNQ
jgi:hypothetical protein